MLRERSSSALIFGRAVTLGALTPANASRSLSERVRAAVSGARIRGGQLL
jgi:hypothetical protein